MDVVVSIQKSNSDGFSLLPTWPWKKQKYKSNISPLGKSQPSLCNSSPASSGDPQPSADSLTVITNTSRLHAGGQSARAPAVWQRKRLTPSRHFWKFGQVFGKAQVPNSGPLAEISPLAKISLLAGISPLAEISLHCHYIWPMKQYSIINVSAGLSLLCTFTNTRNPRIRLNVLLGCRKMVIEKNKFSFQTCFFHLKFDFTCAKLCTQNPIVEDALVFCCFQSRKDVGKGCLLKTDGRSIRGGCVLRAICSTRRRGEKLSIAGRPDIEGSR